MKLAAVLVTALLLVPLTAGCQQPQPAPGPMPAPAPVTSVLPAEHPRDFPENLRWLTEEEKEKAVAIALSTPQAQEWTQKESQYQTAISWIALNPNSEGEGYSGYRKFEYEIVAEGIPRGTVDITPPDSPERVVSVGVPDDAEIYPDVTIRFGEPAEWIVTVAVDLEAGKAVYTEGYPSLSPPDRFPPHMLEVSGTPSQAEYLPRQPVEVEFSLHNVYSEPVVISNPPAIWVLHHDLPGSTEDWIIRSYAGGTEQLTIKPGETITHEFVWDQKDDEGKLVTSGHYHIQLAERPQAISGKEGMRLGQEFEVFIQYEQGAMKKTIDLNQSQTVSGVPLPPEGSGLLTDLTITLQRLELSEQSARFYALATLPEYTYNSPYDYYPMHWMLADAEYLFDGISKDAGCADVEASAEGIRLWWGYVNPRDQVPRDAKELTFRVMIRFDEPKKWYGPWEFKVSLE